MRNFGFAICFALLFAVSAFAQEKTFKLEVSTTDANLIGEAIGFLPYNKANPLLQKLQAQIIQQQQPVEEKKPEESGNNDKK